MCGNADEISSSATIASYRFDIIVPTSLPDDESPISYVKFAREPKECRKSSWFKLVNEVLGQLEKLSYDPSKAGLTHPCLTMPQKIDCLPLL